ncbi:MAG: ribonuclease P protein component [Alphaproteobacteria bacterium]
MRKRRDFLAAKRNVRWRGGALRIEARKRKMEEREPRDVIRIGFTATRVTIGNAVRRNRVRRRLRAAVRKMPPSAFVAGGDYVIIATDRTLSAPWEGLVGELHLGLADIAIRFNEEKSATNSTNSTKHSPNTLTQSQRQMQRRQKRQQRRQQQRQI